MRRSAAATLILVLPVLGAALGPRPVAADPHPEGRAFAQHAPGGHGHRFDGPGGREGRGHVFGPRWKETLTEAQRVKIDGLHRELRARVQTLKAEIGLREAELNGLVASDSVDRSAMRGKIDQITDLRRAAMQAHYDHVLEMRKLLSPEQRITFDLELLYGHHRPH